MFSHRQGQVVFLPALRGANTFKRRKSLREPLLLFTILNLRDQRIGHRRRCFGDGNARSFERGDLPGGGPPPA